VFSCSVSKVEQRWSGYPLELSLTLLADAIPAKNCDKANSDSEDTNRPASHVTGSALLLTLRLGSRVKLLCSHKRHDDNPTKEVNMPGTEAERVYLAEAVICQDAADITVAGHEPHKGFIPNLDFGKRVLLPQLGKHCGGLGPRRPLEREAQACRHMRILRI
jgi:hypothetical protein